MPNERVGKQRSMIHPLIILHQLKSPIDRKYRSMIYACASFIVEIRYDTVLAPFTQNTKYHPKLNDGDIRYV